jgi:ubiquinone/menaquinone biosynthesis C-methylase UbiE
MDIMHPLRHKMIEIALYVLPFPREQALKVLDLGVGTGAFTLRFLERYSNSTVLAIDGSSSMLELAKARLGEYAHRVECQVSEFRAIPATILEPDAFDVVISSYALHHLSASEKHSLLRAVVPAIRPGGWILNADIVVADSPEIEQRIQELRVEAVTQRAPVDDERFCNPAATKRYLEEMEELEQDQPQTLADDIRVLRESGIENIDVFWKELREAVIGGSKAKAS